MSTEIDKTAYGVNRGGNRGSLQLVRSEGTPPLSDAQRLIQAYLTPHMVEMLSRVQRVVVKEDKVMKTEVGMRMGIGQVRLTIAELPPQQQEEFALRLIGRLAKEPDEQRRETLKTLLTQVPLDQLNQIALQTQYRYALSRARETQTPEQEAIVRDMVEIGGIVSPPIEGQKAPKQPQRYSPRINRRREQERDLLKVFTGRQTARLLDLPYTTVKGQLNRMSAEDRAALNSEKVSYTSVEERWYAKAQALKRLGIAPEVAATRLGVSVDLLTVPDAQVIPTQREPAKLVFGAGATDIAEEREEQQEKTPGIVFHSNGRQVGMDEIDEPGVEYTL